MRNRLWVRIECFGVFHDVTENVLQTMVHPDPMRLIPQLRLREHRRRYQPGPARSLTHERSG